MTDPLVAALTAAVGPDHVLLDADVRAGYEVDWLHQWGAPSRCVVRPGSAEEVAAVVRACAAAGASIVPQGGNTGLVGGSVPRGGEVLLSLRRLDSLGPVDVAAQQVTAGAGVTIERLQEHARAAGLDFAVDWGAGQRNGGRGRQHQCRRLTRVLARCAQVAGVRYPGGRLGDH